MSSVNGGEMYQQKIPLRGSEASLNLFTELLRELKGSGHGSSADVLLAAAVLWRNRPRAPKAECTASARFDGQTHAFYLQLLTSTRTQQRIGEELDALRRDTALKSVIDRDGTVSRNEFLLEALIVILQLLKLQTKYLGRQWRKSNMKTMSAIYQKVRHRLGDDWAYGNGKTCSCFLFSVFNASVV